MHQIVCAIHQPNFFPWLGYFDKIRQADCFVFMDDVAYPKSGSGSGTWCNRVQLNIQGKPAWVGCPVRREPGVQPIWTVRMDNNQPWRKKLLKTLEFNYGRSPYYTEAMQILAPLIAYETDNLADFNIHAIQALCQVLSLKTRFIRQSELQADGKATMLLINLVKAAGANAYLCGGGAQGYQEDGLFPQHHIQLIYQQFKPQPYGNPQRFLPGLSIIDFLMHCPVYEFAGLCSPEPLVV